MSDLPSFTPLGKHTIFKRSAETELLSALQTYPIALVTGPRQSGKSTLVKSVLPKWQYVSLEDLDLRNFAKSDPRGFLRQYQPPLIIDEVQRVPDLLSYLQSEVDRIGQMGRYVLSGSQQFSLLASVTQSLAGRVGIVEMYPLRLKEIVNAGFDASSIDRIMLSGGYPAVFARQVDPERYYSDYTRTYIERDVRSLTAVQDLGTFQRFLRLCAARSGQLLNLNGLANDCGISQPTAAAWMNVLEASYLVKRVAPFYQNFGKRLVKAPKLYFLDTGLCAWLLGIFKEQSLSTHYARGALFETWVVTEAIKWQSIFAAGRPVYFWRDNIGNEVDLLIESASGVNAIEIKSGQTFQPEWLRPLQTLQRHIGLANRRAVVYGGDTNFDGTEAAVVAWRNLIHAG